jgi:hypothetical protein
VEEWKNRAIGQSIKCPDCGGEVGARIASPEHLRTLLVEGQCPSCGISLSCVKCKNEDCGKIVPCTDNCMCCGQLLESPLNKAPCVYPPCE